MDYSSGFVKGQQITLIVQSQPYLGTVEDRAFDQAFVRLLSPEAAPVLVGEEPLVVQWANPPLRWEQIVLGQTHASDPGLIIVRLIGMPKAIEQRRSRRVATRWPLDIRWGRFPGRSVAGEILDISTHGVRCVVARALPDDTPFMVRVRTPDRTWHCPATILRQESESDTQWVVVLIWQTGGDTALLQQWIAQYAN